MNGHTMESLFVLAEGEGAPVLFIHGSAADHTTWTLQRAGLRGKLRLITYDRRGAGSSPLPADRNYLSIEEHAQDAARLLEAHPGPMLACGSSFGAVVLLELVRSRPELLCGAVLIEPPIGGDDIPFLGPEFLERFDQTQRERGGPAAAELFLRTVLGDEAFDRIPRPFQERSMALWRSIRQDCLSLLAYRVRYSSLGRLQTPVLLLGGERSAPRFGHTLAALHTFLGNASVETVPGAGHILQADAHRRFNARLLQFLEQVGPGQDAHGSPLRAGGAVRRL